MAEGRQGGAEAGSPQARAVRWGVSTASGFMDLQQVLNELQDLGHEIVWVLDSSDPAGEETFYTIIYKWRPDGAGSGG
jgi:hypothetical protein